MSGTWVLLLSPRPTDLGRGGSDYAFALLALFGRLLGEEVTGWKD